MIIKPKESKRGQITVLANISGNCDLTPIVAAIRQKRPAPIGKIDGEKITCSRNTCATITHENNISTKLDLCLLGFAALTPTYGLASRKAFLAYLFRFSMTVVGIGSSVGRRSSGSPCGKQRN